ncbi:MAG: ATP-binding region ATPase domain protein [Gemmatimonadetes bacterium]|nr:ATP-binding region ATPase domain protein [Gemmatimonadota bacterium]
MDEERRTEPAPTTRALERTWWVPLAFVVLSLLLLAMLPVVVNQRVSVVRRALVDVTEPARVNLSEIQAALNTELYGIVETTHGPAGHGAGRYAQGLEDQLVAEREMEPLVRQMGTEAISRFAALRSSAARWNQQASQRWLQPAVGSDTSDRSAEQREQTATEVLAATVRLDSLLDQRAADQRDRIESLSNNDTLLPLALVPLMIVSALIIFRAGRRMYFFANEAEQGRMALTRATEAKAGLMRGVTHDLKNPLGAASGYAQLLEEGVVGPLTADQRDRVTRIRRLVLSALDTINDLVELSRAEEGQLHITRTPTDVANLVPEVVADYQAAAESAKLQMSIDSAVEHMNVKTDPKRVRQILGNLLSNAIKYTPAGGSVHVRLESRTRSRPGDWYAIEVRDTGRGIPEEHREDVFVEFYRLPNAQTIANGTGIGLAISRRLARLLGGDLTLERAGGAGSAFTLWLPRT